MAEINISDITSGSVTGSGIFDELMKGVTARLDEQYAKNRLKGADYASVYLGSIQAAMQQAMAFALEKQRADKQAELLTAQIAEQLDATIRANTQLNDTLETAAKQRAQFDAEIAFTNSKNNEQIRDTVRKDLLLDKQLELQNKEIDFKDIQIASENQNMLLKSAQTAEVLDGTTRANTELSDKLLSTVIERDKSTAQIALISAQEAEQLDGTIRENTKLSDMLESSTKEREKADSQIILLNAQTNEQIDQTDRANTELADKLENTVLERIKINSDIEFNQMRIAEQVDATTRANVELNDKLLITAKQREEIAEKIQLTSVQTAEISADSTRKDGLHAYDLVIKENQSVKLAAEISLLNQKTATEINNTDLIIKQQELYTAQKDGFARDAEQKAAKLWVDIWSVSRGTDEGFALPITVDQAQSGEMSILLRDLATKAGLSIT